MKVVNGTKCLLEKLLWKDASIEAEVDKVIRRAIRNNETEVDPDTPPDVVFVILLDKHGKIRKREDFPIDLSFLDNCNENRVMIPIPLRKHEDLEICKEEKVIVKYIDHVFDLGYASTA